MVGVLMQIVKVVQEVLFLTALLAVRIEEQACEKEED